MNVSLDRKRGREVTVERKPRKKDVLFMICFFDVLSQSNRCGARMQRFIIIYKMASSVVSTKQEGDN